MGVAASIVPALRLSLAYTTSVVETIPDGQFAHMPRADLNSPAFCIGHLAIYAPRLGEALGIQVPHVPAAWPELFQHGAPCVDRPGLYAPKQELVDAFMNGWGAVADGLPSVAESTLAQPNPVASLAQRLPTKGAFTAFMCLSHTMVHLGQISAWRRVVGLGPAM